MKSDQELLQSTSVEEIQEILLDLVKKGVILSECPICKVTLSFAELKKSKCKICSSKFDKRAVQYRHIDSIPDC